MTGAIPPRIGETAQRVVVLMYHALYANERERADIDAADRPYAASIDEFIAHLDAIESAGLPLLDPAELPRGAPPSGGVVLSFDDGHASAHRHAMPELLKRGARAVFFVTSDFVGKRRGFCGAGQLREMATSGMTIGAHGRTHRFIDALSEDEARSELAWSRSALEQDVGAQVEQMSFPGGRHGSAHLRWGREAGYSLMYTSVVGSHAPRDFVPGAALRRVAIKGGWPISRLTAMARADTGPMLRAQLAAGVKQSVRRAVGNKLYHAVYERLAG